MSVLKVNRAKRALREGKVAIGTMVSLVRSPQTKKSIDNIESLVSVRGVDAVFIGPYDLSKTLGIAGQTRHPLMMECFEKVIAACEKYGVAPGVHLQDMALAKEWIARGMRFLGLKLDARYLMEGMAAATKELRDGK